MGCNKDVKGICSNLINDLIESKINNKSYVLMLCGSSLFEENPRDTDVFIYVKSNIKQFCTRLFNYFKTIDQKVRFTYLDTLKFYSIKYRSGGIDYSLHLVAINQLQTFVRQMLLTETFTDINIFEFKLFLQTTYRKWILETEYLFGNKKLREKIMSMVLDYQNYIPIFESKRILMKRLQNNINYYYEKVKTEGLISNVILLQIVNNLINYCYLSNKTFYGTIKYIEKDLLKFTEEKLMCELVKDLLLNLNCKSVKYYIQKLEVIKNTIENNKKEYDL